MFGFGKNKEEKKAADEIGKCLHKQIRDALTENEAMAGMKLQTPIAAGYIYNFIMGSFIYQGIRKDGMAQKYIQYICDGVLPNRLWAAVSKVIQHADQFESELQQGMEAGTEDAFYFDEPGAEYPSNLYRFLTGKDFTFPYTGND